MSKLNSTKTILEKLAAVGVINIVKHLPSIDNGFNVGIEFEDGRGISVPGKTLREACLKLLDDYHVKYALLADERKKLEGK